MDERRPSDLSLPYGEIAAWGVGLSVVASLVLLLAAPFSPVRFAARVLDGGADVRAVLPLAGGGPPAAEEVSRRAVGEILGAGAATQWTRVLPEVSAELAREWTRLAPGLREELRRELRRELRGGLRLEIAPSPPDFPDGS